MSAVGALVDLAWEKCVAHMACSADPLRDRLICDLFTSCSRGYGQRFQIQSRVRHCSSRTACGCHPFSLLLLCSLRREARTFFAAIVLAVAADLIWTEGGLAAMACTVHTHANLLLHALRVRLDG